MVIIWAKAEFTALPMKAVVLMQEAETQNVILWVDIPVRVAIQKKAHIVAVLLMPVVEWAVCVAVILVTAEI